MIDKELKNVLYSNYLKARIKYTIDLSNLRRVYETKYYWMKDHLEDILPNRKDSKILVLGCGVGHEIYALNKMGYKNVLGIDISEEQIKIAKSNELNCIKADAFKFLENNSEKFDVIIAFNFIEHFSLGDAFKLLTLCHKSLTKKGILILLTPNASNPLATHMIYSDPTHIIAFTEMSIRQLLISIGFNEVRFKNVKPFGKLDNRITIKILKLLVAFVINLTWKLVKLVYWLSGIKPPKVVSPDLLVIAYKE